jgi:hypothetical protein
VSFPRQVEVFGRGQFGDRIDPDNLIGVIDAHRRHRAAGLHKMGDGVREIEFALVIVVAQHVQDRQQLVRSETENSRVVFADFPLRLGGVARLDDGLQLVVRIAHDPAIGSGILDNARQHRRSRFRVRGFRNQTPQGRGFQKRDISGQHNGHSATAQSPGRDLHSGSFGGSVTNPANALAQMLAALVDDRGRVQIPGFYDDVVPLSDKERRQLAALPFDEQEYFRELGVDSATGEEGFTTLERRWARPTYDLCGLTSGYAGEGAKTVIPATATAKFSFRLVPEQDPRKISAALRARFAELCPPGVRMELVDLHGSPSVLVPLNSPYVEAAARAIEHAFGRRPVFTREGGSIPIVTAFHETLGADTLLLGWGQDDDNTHSPTEKFSLADFHRGIQASARLWEELAACPPRDLSV